MINSKLRGITELKQSDLSEIFSELPLPLHVPLDGLPVGPLSHCRHIVPVAPKFPSPQHPFHSRLPPKDFSSREALEQLHNPSWRHFRMRTAEHVVVDLPRTGRSLSNRIFPLIRHTPEGTREPYPRSKLRGITR